MVDHKRTPLHLRTYSRHSCYEQDEKIMGPPIQAMGSVGKVWGYEANEWVDAIVLSDSGECCGGGDDIKICARRYNGINDWDVYWIDALEFIPNE